MGDTQIVHVSQSHRNAQVLEEDIALFKHLALSLPDARDSVHQIEQEFMSYDYPEGKRPILQHLDLYDDQDRSGNIYHFLIEKLNYSWTGASWAALDPRPGGEEQLSIHPNQFQTIERVRSHESEPQSATL